MRAIAEAMADSWTVIDSAHRFHDLLTNLPGLSKAPWLRVMKERIDDALALRDCVQHQLGEIDELIKSAGQIWGYLSWAEVREGQHTGWWLMVSPGSNYIGDSWLFAGPLKLPFPVPEGRIRLNAFGRQVYLGRTVAAIGAAVTELCRELEKGAIRCVGEPATNRGGADMVSKAAMQVLVKVSPPRPDGCRESKCEDADSKP